MKSWILKLHLYLGLYFLVFLWLFSVSGLLLNHRFTFAEFYTNRRQTNSERTIMPPTAASDLDRAADLAQQLGLTGEVEWTQTRPNAERFDFRMNRPGHFIDVKTDLVRRVATLQEVQYNGWGILRSLHTFNGVGVNSPRAERDWPLTKLWTFAMDAVATGIIVLVVSSLMLAWLRREKRVGAVIAFAAGCLVCGLFVFALRWF